MNTEQINSGEKPQNKKYTAANSLINYYLAIMFTFFPLFLTDQYAHARTDKFWLFVILTAVTVVAVGICRGIEISEARRIGEKESFLLPLSVTDIFMLCFVGFAAISTIISQHPYEAFFAFGCRDNGLFLLIFYMLMYFAVTRNYVRKDYVFAGYLIASCIVALLTVLNFYYIDPLNVMAGYDEETILDFGSTIGNKNIIATYMCVFLPVAIGLFVVSEKRFMRILSGVAIVFAYTGLICADSTSDILGLAVILPVMLIFFSRSFGYLKRYLLALTIAFTSGKLLQIFSLFDLRDKGFEFMQSFLINSPLIYILIAVCGGGWLLMCFIGKNGEPAYPAKLMQGIFIALFAAAVIAAVGAFIYYSFIDLESDIGEFEKLLRFDDYWGTHRGFMWRVSMEEYGRFDILHRFFGSGPDTLYYVFEPHFAELSERFGDGSTDCAHNEFINYLVTQGALGLVSYIGMMGSAIFSGLKTAKKEPITLVFISAVICYLAQSVVNLYNPIVTPYLFIFLALTEAMTRNRKAKNI